MDLGLQGRVALVSGASAGLGRAIATELVAEGARVAIASRSRERIDATAASIGATGFVWDTADVDGAPALLRDVAEAFGEEASIVVCNTGGPPPGEDPLAFTREQWEAAYRSLVLAPMALVEHALPGMRSRGYGRVLSVASVAVREPIPRIMLSSSHRAALVAAFKTVAQRVAADGVTLNTLLPGSFATDRIFSGHGSPEAAEEHARTTVPAARLGDPAELAALAAFLCSARAGYLTGETIAIDGGVTRSVF
jgi:3-oxoacyl-[acyl-carrier protein] reductase